MIGLVEVTIVEILVTIADTIRIPDGPVGPGSTSYESMFDGRDSIPFVFMAVAMKYHLPNAGKPTVACVSSPASLICVHSLVLCEKYRKYFLIPEEGDGFHVTAADVKLPAGAKLDLAPGELIASVLVNAAEHSAELAAPAAAAPAAAAPKA